MVRIETIENGQIDGESKRPRNNIVQCPCSSSTSIDSRKIERGILFASNRKERGNKNFGKFLLYKSNDIID